jgi:Putative 2OG-Fe(II) oxygenase
MPDGTTELEAPVENQLGTWTYFPSLIYTIEKPEFLKVVKEVSEERLKIQKAQKKVDPIYPVIMTDNLFTDDRMTEFTKYVGQTAWNILQSQGYAMDNLVTTFESMWAQEHHKHSLMEQHVHGFGAQLVGFYFLEVPEKSSNVVFHDPRAGKVQTNLPETDVSLVTPASQMINFSPKPGLLMFANSWLPHSFGRHAANKPMKFVHFNLNVQVAQTVSCPMPAAEIV